MTIIASSLEAAFEAAEREYATVLDNEARINEQLDRALAASDLETLLSALALPEVSDRWYLNGQDPITGKVQMPRMAIKVYGHWLSAKVDDAGITVLVRCATECPCDCAGSWRHLLEERPGWASAQPVRLLPMRADEIKEPSVATKNRLRNTARIAAAVRWFRDEHHG